MKKTRIYAMCLCALFAAILCIFGPMAVPIGPIPVSLTNLVLYVAIIIIGTKYTSISYLVYLALGIIGLPVFSGGMGGPAKLTGPTGGYLIGFILMIVVAGIFFEVTKGNLFFYIIGFIISTAIAYAFGTAWYVYSTDNQVWQALSVCVFPFIPFDIGKIVIAYVIGLPIRRALIRGNLISGFKNKDKD